MSNQTKNIKKSINPDKINKRGKQINEETEEDLLYFIENMNLLKNNINYYNHKLIKLIYNIYFDKNINKVDDTKKIEFSVFKDSIFKNKKNDINKKVDDKIIQDIIDDKDSLEYDNCQYLIYNKGNVRYCKNKRIDGSKCCRFHKE